jgi:hypothetical protein
MTNWQEVIEKDIWMIWTNIEENYYLLQFYLHAADTVHDLALYVKELYHMQIDEITQNLPENLQLLVLEIMGNPGQSVFDSIAERLWEEKEFEPDAYDG